MGSSKKASTVDVPAEYAVRQQQEHNDVPVDAPVWHEGIPRITLRALRQNGLALIQSIQEAAAHLV